MSKNGLNFAVECNVNFWQRPTGFIFVILMVFMALQVVMKKPYCIDSSIVHKIDIQKQTEVGLVQGAIYSCQSLQKPTGHPLILSEIDRLSARLGRLEALLGRLALHRFFQLDLDLSNQKNLQWQDSTLVLNLTHLESQMTIETELLKKSLTQNLFKQNPAVAATFADILLQNKESNEPHAQIWFEIEKNLNAWNRIKLRSYLFNTIKNKEFLKEDSVETALNKVWAKYSENLLLAEYQKLLIQRGLKWTNEPFDLVIHTNGTHQEIENKIKNLSHLQSKARIGVMDSTGFYTWPHFIKISPQDSLKHQTKLRLIFTDRSLHFAELVKFSHSTDQLLMVKMNQKIIKEIELQPLFEQNLNAFLKRNKDLDFIQMHMASFEFRSQFFNQDIDLFSWLKKSDNEQEKIAALGWQSKFWSLELQAYKPIAVYDVIQSFRIN